MMKIILTCLFFVLGGLGGASLLVNVLDWLRDVDIGLFCNTIGNVWFGVVAVIVCVAIGAIYIKKYI